MRNSKKATKSLKKKRNRRGGQQSTRGMTAPRRPTILTLAREFFLGPSIIYDKKETSWLSGAKWLAGIIMQVITIAAASSSTNTETSHRIADMTCLEFGIDELLADGPDSAGIPPTQAAVWGLSGVRTTNVTQAALKSVKIQVNPSTTLASRKGTILVALEPIPRDESDEYGQAATFSRLRFPSLTALQNLPGAKMFDASSPINVTYHTRGDVADVQTVGIPGVLLAKGTPPYSSYITRWGSDRSTLGGRPLLRLFVASVHVTGGSAPSAEDNNTDGLTVNIRGDIRVMEKGGIASFTTTSAKNDEVMELYSLNLIRCFPINVSTAGQIMVLSDGPTRFWSHDKVTIDHGTYTHTVKTTGDDDFDPAKYKGYWNSIVAEDKNDPDPTPSGVSSPSSSYENIARAVSQIRV